MHSTRTEIRLIVVCMAALSVVACGIDVRESGEGGKTEVDVRTPLGSVSVETDVDTPETGLPVYDGARVRRSGDDPGSANVSVGMPFVDVKVVAANFEHDADPQTVLAFYRTAMRQYGDVVECRGNVDFSRRNGAMRPVCDERGSSREIQLVVGSEERHRLVSVKPLGSGTEFSVVYVQTSKG